MISTTPLLTVLNSSVPTMLFPTIMFTVPLVICAPVVLSVTLTFTVTLPAVLLTIDATVVLSRGTTFIANVLLVALYVSSPG